LSQFESIVARMGTVTWSAGDATAHAVALEGIDSVIGAYSGLISRSREEGDALRTEALLAERRRWSGRRRDIHVSDRAGVDRLIQTAADRLALLRTDSRAAGPDQ